jgi:SAM-dependent methyltransferase
MDATLRFSDRVENYSKYRPSYPVKAIDLLEAECGLKAGAHVADIGSGTGISAELLLERGAKVYAVEPNAEMRAVAEAKFAGRPGFMSLPNPAESTGIGDGVIDLVVAAQAFHWFDKPRFRMECMRILRPGGCVALIWNNRKTDASPFLQEYEKLLRNLGTDYLRVDHNLVTEADFNGFFGSDAYHLSKFQNEQVFGWEGFLGRVLSSSYTPPAGHPDHQPLIEGLRGVYDKYQQGGQVAFVYDTEVYWGSLV